MQNLKLELENIKKKNHELEIKIIKDDNEKLREAIKVQNEFEKKNLIFERELLTEK